MSYLVISCTGCGRPRVTQQDQQTTTCHRCGDRIQIENASQHASTDTLQAAQNAVGQINAKRAGEELPDPAKASPPARDAVDQALADARSATSQRARVRRAAEGLTEAFDTFTMEDWVQALGRIDIPQDRAIEHLQRLKQANIVTEPDHGTYRAIG